MAQPMQQQRQRAGAPPRSVRQRHAGAWKRWLCRRRARPGIIASFHPTAPMQVCRQLPHAILPAPTCVCVPTLLLQVHHRGRAVQRVILHAQPPDRRQVQRGAGRAGGAGRGGWVGAWVDSWWLAG